MRIKEIIVVEGRDDTAAINRALDAQTIETHGFGIRRETWELIENAYNNPELGIIIFTDPDHAGNEIRRRIKEKCPGAKEAFLARKDATKADDIGIENASPEAIIEALSKAKGTLSDRDGVSGGAVFTREDIVNAGLTGLPDSKEKREFIGKELGIGYANASGLLKKLNHFGIEKGDFYEAVRAFHNKRD